MKGMIKLARAIKSTPTEIDRRRRPAKTLEERENQLVLLATDRAEQQLRDNTASSQVITHYLKLGSPIARLERERLEHENELLKAKTDALKSNKRVEELYANALGAMKQYSGNSRRGDDEEDYNNY